MHQRLLLAAALTVAGGCASKPKTTTDDSNVVEPYPDWYASAHGETGGGGGAWSGPGAGSGPGLDAINAAGAKASLGLAQLDEGRPTGAAQLFEEAAALLRGQAGSAGGTGAGGAGGVSTHAGAAGFTIQAGAFRERARAEDVAAEVSQLGLGQARIVSKRRLAAVQVGDFQSRQAAMDALRSVGRSDFIVTKVY